MDCMKCGHELMEGAKFCPYCGEKVSGEKLAEEKPIYLAEVKGVLKSGKLAVYHDRVEFVMSNIQKTVFNYSALIAVKKGLDRIIFVTEDGSSESCVVNRKNIHEAFLYIEKAARPYIDKRKNALLAEGVKYSFVSSPGIGAAGGVLDVLDDRVQFRGKSGQSEVLSFKNVKSVGISMGMLGFALLDGNTKSFTVDKEIRDEVLSFIQRAVAPYIAERKEALLAKGIYYSFPSNQGQESGTLDILGDRVEFRSVSGRNEAVFFQDVRTAKLFMATLELSLTDGTSRSFTVDKDVREEVLAFIENAIRPYVMERVAGFGLAFGIDERIEVNKDRGVFHIIRQGGREITAEYRMEDLLKCECVEHSVSGDKIGYVGVILSLRAGQDVLEAKAWFGDFSIALSRMNKKYDRYIAEVSRFMDYLGGNFPECELIMPVVPENEAAKALLPELPEAENILTEAQAEAAGAAGDAPGEGAEAVLEDQFGIRKYIDGIAKYVRGCATPMTIAVQGGWGTGKNSILTMLSDKLEEDYGGNLIWFNTWQLSQVELGEQLPMLVGNKLISLLGGNESGTTNDRAIKVAKGLINILSGVISQGGTDGQMIADALFKDSATNSMEKLVETFSGMIRERTGGKNNKAIIFVNELDKLAPEKGVELLEAMRNFFECEGCVFVVDIDYNVAISGVKERYGRNFDENRAKDFLDKILQVSFRIPASGYNIENYVREKLEQIEVDAKDEEEFRFYVDLIRHSVGGDPKSMDRLFNSLLLLKTIENEEVYENRIRRLMLFALLCMQMKFPDIYDFMVRVKDQVDADFLQGLCRADSEALSHSRFSEDEKTKFLAFASVLCDIIDTDDKDGISERECNMFAEVLDFSSITSK